MAQAYERVYESLIMARSPRRILDLAPVSRSMVDGHEHITPMPELAPSRSQRGGARHAQIVGD